MIEIKNVSKEFKKTDNKKKNRFLSGNTKLYNDISPVELLE